MKHCTKCDREKHEECFAVSSVTPDGRQAWCRDCKSRQPVAPLKPVAGLPFTEKHCPACEETKSPLDFALKVSDDPSFGLQSWCKECMKSYKRSRRQAQSPAFQRFERMVREQNKQDYYELLKTQPNLTNQPNNDTLKK